MRSCDEKSTVPGEGGTLLDKTGGCRIGSRGSKRKVKSSPVELGLDWP